MAGSHNPLNPDAVADFLVNRYDDAEDPTAELTDSTDMDMNLAKKLVGAWSKLDVMKRHKMGFKEKDMLAWVNDIAGKHESKVGRVKELKALTEEKFDTPEKQVKAIKKKGNILTFKKPVRWKGEEYKQIIIDSNSIRKENKKYCFSAPSFDSEWCDSLEELAALIDWKDYEKRVAATKELRRG